MRKIKRILAVALSAATLFSLTACEKEESTATGEWTVETVYAKAQELGFEGTWEEFKEQMRGAQGVGIGDVGVSADGDSASRRFGATDGFLRGTFCLDSPIETV